MYYPARLLPQNDQIDPKMLKIRQIDPKISKKCVSYCKIPTQDKTTGLPLKILLLVPRPTRQLLPSCRDNLHLCSLPISKLLLTLMLNVCLFVLVHVLLLVIVLMFSIFLADAGVVSMQLSD